MGHGTPRPIPAVASITLETFKSSVQRDENRSSQALELWVWVSGESLSLIYPLGLEDLTSRSWLSCETCHLASGFPPFLYIHCPALCLVCGSLLSMPTKAYCDFNT